MSADFYSLLVNSKCSIRLGSREEIVFHIKKIEEFEGSGFGRFVFVEVTITEELSFPFLSFELFYNLVVRSRYWDIGNLDSRGQPIIIVLCACLVFLKFLWAL